MRDTHFNFIAIGDYIVASGMNDGTAIAVSPKDIAPEQGHIIVGRAWAASDEQGVKLINTVVGLPESASTTAALARTVTMNTDAVFAFDEGSLGTSLQAGGTNPGTKFLTRWPAGY